MCRLWFLVVLKLNIRIWLAVRIFENDMEKDYIKRIIDDPSIRIISSRILDGERITLDEAILLMKKAQTGLLGMLAAEVNKLRYTENRKHTVVHIALSKDCDYKCAACKYSEEQNPVDILDISELNEVLKSTSIVDEIILSSAINRDVNLSYLTKMISKVRELFPNIDIKGLRAIQLKELSLREKIDYSYVLASLKEAGLNSMLGGDALIFRPEMRTKMQDYNLTEKEWLSIHKQAHDLGLKSDATITYGHFESVEDRISHMEKLRNLQDQTKGFNAFFPLKFRANTGMSKLIPSTSGLEDMRVFAISRIFLDNIPNIDVFTVIGEDGWEEVFGFGGNQITVADEVSDLFLPQYGNMAIVSPGDKRN